MGLSGVNKYTDHNKVHARSWLPDGEISIFNCQVPDQPITHTITSGYSAGYDLSGTREQNRGLGGEVHDTLMLVMLRSVYYRNMEREISKFICTTSSFFEGIRTTVW